MQQNTYTPKIHLYSFRDGRWIACFESEAKLLEYFVRNYSVFFGPNHDVNLTWNDTKTIVSFTGETKTVLRNYVLVDGNNRVVNPATYKDKVEAIMKGLSESELERYHRFEQMKLLHMWHRWSKEIPVEHDELKHGDVLFTDKTFYRFRCDPVPGQGHNRWHFGNFYRYPKTTAEKKYIADPEYGHFIRRSRKLTPTTYDDIPRGRQRSWKEQGKRAKQWM